MNKTRGTSRKSKNNRTKRRRKISGGRTSGYDAALVLWPTYELDEAGNPSKFLRFKERFVTMHNLGMNRRMEYINDWIQLNVADEPLVQETVVPVVHRLTGKHPKKTDNVVVTDQPISSTTGNERQEIDEVVSEEKAVSRGKVVLEEKAVSRGKVVLEEKAAKKIKRKR